MEDIYSGKIRTPGWCMSSVEMFSWIKTIETAECLS